MALTNCQYLAAQVNQLLWRDLEEPSLGMSRRIAWVTGVVRTRRVLAQLNCTGDGLANNRTAVAESAYVACRQQSDEPQFTRRFAFRVELL